MPVVPVLGETTVTDLTSFIEAVKAPMEANLTLGNLAIVIVAGLTISVGLTLGWFGFRWIWGKIKKAFFAGH